jgi:glycosyltransferase involved in cell wall biosynthesis
MGGEAALPFHFFRVLRARGVDARLVTHARNRDELAEAWPNEQDRIYYAPDDWLHKLLYRVGHLLPNRLSRATFGLAAEYHTERQQRRILRRLIAEGNGNLVHKPIPVSPVQPSILHSLGVPVIFGPMNGGMDYPPGFRRHENPLERLAVRIGRRFGGLVNRIFPGKARAALLLVANARTRQTLPRRLQARPVAELPENGVDLPLWRSQAADRSPNDTLRFVFLGRLVDWKAVDLLLEAWSQALGRGLAEARLQIIGDGPMMADLRAQSERMGLGATVEFLGWQPQTEAAKYVARADTLVLPSLLECGGAVVLEAMAAGLPVIAAKWGVRWIISTIAAAS